GGDGSIDSTATFRSRARALLTRVPISVDLPTPGGPVNPTTAARPVFGKISRTSAQPSGSSFSTSEIARARARFSPANRRSASSAAVLGRDGTERESYERTPAKYDRACSGNSAPGDRRPAAVGPRRRTQRPPAAATRRPPHAAQVHAPQPDAEPEVRAPAHRARAPEAPHLIWPPPEARRPRLRRPR